jgi:pimeloyl-ACP methyl ester carboxylesterase
MESLETVQYLLPQNITMFCFDFPGCGNSEGEYISLGWWERDDIAVIIEHLRAQRRVSTVALWGRSMGAATALLHADRDPSIAGIVLDSPFSDLSKLVNELVYHYTKLPSFLVSPLLKLVSNSIMVKADFDIYNLSPINHVRNSFIPALFATGSDDNFIQPHHS